MSLNNKMSINDILFKFVRDLQMEYILTFVDKIK